MNPPPRALARAPWARLAAVGLALVLAIPAAGAALAAGATPQSDDAPGTQETEFLLGGTHALLTAYGPYGLRVDEDRVAAAATCPPPSPVPLPSLPPPHPIVDAVDAIGGTCFDLGPYADGEAIEVTVTPTPAGDPSQLEDPSKATAFAVGYDGDDDGCIGCSPADTLWRTHDSIVVPAVQSEPTLVVFVYGLATDVDVGEPPSTLTTGLVGQIAVQPADEPAPACTPGADDPADRCGLPPAELAPHRCVPDCARLAFGP